MKDIFGEHGHLSSILPVYEYRKEQLEMADFILECLVNSENGIIEAGTGTGKTLAYLLPVVLFAMEQDKKIAISTETKALQKQLIDKDLPIVHEVIKKYFDADFSYSLCLGNSNYPCRKRYENALKSGKFRQGELKKLAPVSALFNGKKAFTHFDVSLPGYIWNEINRESDSCDSYRCPFAATCSYQVTRKECGQSHLLVMNHYLFFTNIASGKTYLPPCDIVVFDEAHSLEDIAASQIGFNLGYSELLEILSRFQGDRKHTIINSIGDESLRSLLLELIHRIVPEITNYFEGLRKLVKAEKNFIRLRDPGPAADGLVDLLKELMIRMAEAERYFDDDHPLRVDFDVARGKLFTYLESLSSFVFQKSENYVYWIDREADVLLGDLFLRGQPVNISEIFQREIVSCYDSSIFVSATLAIGGDFSYIVNRLGIENHRSMALESSFDYRSQVVLYIAGALPDPASPAYNARASSDAAEIINYLEGNCLLLFTSYRTLRDVKGALAGLIEYPIYSQDELSPTDAFDRYVNDTNSVLMGTHSFWQGIDLPGDLVRGVIVTKLPFAVPDSPPMEAKMERLLSQGINPFTGLQVPEAVIRFKQGFGRLIRSSSDRGVVAVLDSRIVNKSYGKVFLKAIPGCTVVHSLRELKDAYALLCC
jgi:ATP-dependent DNA helicase DinG